MPLASKLFRDDVALQECLVSDAGHVTPGAQGDHVSKIQAALVTLGAGVIAPDEIEGMLYGQTTARTVLAFKGPPRNILGPGQTTPDDIVGKQTPASSRPISSPFSPLRENRSASTWASARSISVDNSMGHLLRSWPLSHKDGA